MAVMRVNSSGLVALSIRVTAMLAKSTLCVAWISIKNSCGITVVLVEFSSVGCIVNVCCVCVCVRQCVCVCVCVCVWCGCLCACPRVLSGMDPNLNALWLEVSG